MKDEDISPEAGSRVYFAAATVYAERIKLKDKKVQISGAHRGYMAVLDNGFLIIDQKWYS